MNHASKFYTRLTVAAAIVLLFVSAISQSYSATRSWRGYTSTAWATASNWKEGAVPTSTDDVVFDSAAINQPSITTGFPFSLNSITVSVDSIVMSMSSGATATDSISLTASTGLTISASSKLVLRTPAKTGGNGILVVVNGGGITGTLRLADRSRLQPRGSSTAITFNSGGLCIDSLSTGNPFGNRGTTGNTVVFSSGSTIRRHNINANAFALTAPSSVIVLSHGSTYDTWNASGGSFSGRTYGNFNVHTGINFNTSALGDSMTIDSLTIESGAQM